MADISVIKMPDNTSYNLKDASAREALERKVDLISDSASGNPCIFESSMADMPLKQVKLNWTPTQSGTGDPSPTNVRPISGVSGVNVWQTGKNMANFINGKGVDVYGVITVEASRCATVDPILIKSGASYVFTAKGSDARGIIAVWNGDTLVRRSANIPSGTTIDTSNGDKLYVCVYSNKGSSTYATVEAYEPMVCLSTVSEGYAPYSGTTYPVTFPALGKNLFDEVYPDLEGTIRYRSIYVGDVTVTLSSSGTLTNGALIFLLTGQATSGASTNTNGVGGSTTRTVTATDGYITIAYCTRSSGSRTPLDDDVMLNVGSSALPYEPYTNTVYGGSLNLTTGVLTATLGCVDLGSLDWEKDSAGRISYFFASIDDGKLPSPSAAGTGNGICDCFNVVSKTYDNMSNYDMIVNSWKLGSQKYAVGVRNTSYTEPSDFKTEVSGKYLVYELNTAKTWQLTPQQIQTLIGTNVIWADTNGQIDVEQFIDLQGIKDYIDKQQAENVHDVQINGSSIISNGVANIPIASTNAIGAIQLGYGLTISGTKLYTQPSTDAQIQAGEATYAIIGPATQHKAVFYGLAKAAGADLANETVTTGIYPDSSKAAIQNMLGITDLLSTEESSTATVAHTINSTFMMNGKLHRATVAIAVGDAVEVGTNCEVVKADEVFVKNTDYPSTSNVGVIKVNNAAAHGLQVFTNGTLATKAAISTDIKTGTDGYKPIVSNYVGYAAFYGLSRAAGVDLANETVTFGIYPETSKTAIRSLIGAAAASDVSSKLDTSLKGTASGLAELDANGKVPAAQLPSYVDDVLEYSGSTNFPGTGETGKIYVDISTNITYRWSGSTYVPIGSDLALGETSSTAYRGDRGATAYSHATDSSRLTTAQSAGLYKIATTAEGHIASVTAVVKADITGLGIPAQDTTYESKTAASGGTTVSLVTTGEKYTWNNKYSKPSGGIPASDLENGVIPDVPVQDVEVNGTSVLTNGVASIPMASSTAFGVVKVTDYTYGLAMRSDGNLRTYLANTDQVKAGTEEYRPIVPIRQHLSVFYGLSKVAGVDLANETVTLGTYPDASKAAIQTMLGVPSTTAMTTAIGNLVVLSTTEPQTAETKIWIDNTSSSTVQVPTVSEMNSALAEKISDVQANGTSVVTNGVANIPITGYNTLGVCQVNSSYGIAEGLSNLHGMIYVYKASDSNVKEGTHNYRAIVPSIQHTSVFYGLAKAAGDSTQASSDNAVGTYTTEAKAAIQNMLSIIGTNNLSSDFTTEYDIETGYLNKIYTKVSDVQVNGTSIINNRVANIPLASTSVFGAVKVGARLAIDSDNNLIVRLADAALIKAGTANNVVICPYYTKHVTFYGLAKAAGEDMASSSNEIGTYTDAAKTAIQTMLGAQAAIEVIRL